MATEIVQAPTSARTAGTAPLPPDRRATVADVVKRLKASEGMYEWTAVHALGWGMGPAQLNITDAVNAAERAGLVRTTTLRGNRMVQLAPRSVRIRTLRESIARRALASIGVTAGSSILRVERTGSVLTVATRKADAFYPYAVDSFRLPIAQAADPEFGDDDSPRVFTLVDQHGGFGPDDVDGMMGDALSFAATLRETEVAA